MVCSGCYERPGSTTVDVLPLDSAETQDILTDDVGQRAQISTCRMGQLWME